MRFLNRSAPAVSNQLGPFFVVLRFIHENRILQALLKGREGVPRLRTDKAGSRRLWVAPLPELIAGRAMKEFAMTAVTNVRGVDFPTIEFTISLDSDRSFVVREKRGRSGRVFAELSSAILFVREHCQARGCASVMKFDQNLAFIRAAG
ncbi:hypothetical protein [Rhodoblastus sp.]|uniref:hypothetical protein n=1 Tax=Rhodoblastus sp. TaxID=1962975 RepID=UPI003F9CA998